MARIDATVCRQLKAAPTERELRELYTPTLDERHLTTRHTTGKPAIVAFLVLLKTFQHLRSRNISFLRACSPKEEI